MKISDFLLCPTPLAWISQAPSSLPILLADHANCEKMAASTALNFMYRSIDDITLGVRLSKLAREELRHYEQVLQIMKRREIPYARISPSRYAGELRKTIATHEPGRLVDTLIVSAIVEARSCERFGGLIEVLDAELSDFYSSLLKSEERHFGIYLDFATDLGGDISERVAHFLAIERVLVESDDPDFRFHSGVPMGISNEFS